AKIDGALVEGRRRGYASCLTNGLDQRCVLFIGKSRIERLLDVPEIGTVDEIFMNESLDIAELELDGSAHIIEAHHLGKLLNDLQSPFHTSEMVVSHLQNKEILENILINQPGAPSPTSGSIDPSIALICQNYSAVKPPARYCLRERLRIHAS